ncbi:GNAT family N-acetyltransferase [Massilia sp. RP-1-19]|uniref:Amino-acid acetyltransferase n=1 Tax=Massilia polaris TaxID=2728846 RepID=A0A848HPJ6_9BURK|nr:arsenic resistance N-acetyltransferase ArsN2 [Massilia polaris]NML60498.1 GNAT family N-acetyltransferase [Massilia polaris]
MATIRQATTADLPEIGQILENAGLPFSDIGPSHLPDFLVVEKDSAVVGCVGIERYGRDALLRSLAVDASRQGVGQGRHLVEAIEAHARQSGIARLFLLTTSASGFFEDHGYRAIAREDAPEALRHSTQFSKFCPASAVCMEKDLTQATKAGE